MPYYLEKIENVYYLEGSPLLNGDQLIIFWPDGTKSINSCYLQPTHGNYGIPNRYYPMVKVLCHGLELELNLSKIRLPMQILDPDYLYYDLESNQNNELNMEAESNAESNAESID